jgi:putative membrane protein
MAILPHDHARVADAIRAAEATTDGEIAVIVARASDSYADVVLFWAAVLGLLPLALAAAWPSLLVNGASLLTHWEEPGLHLMLTLLAVACVAAFLLGRWLFGLPALRMRLTPDATKERRVRRRAIMLFRTGTEHRTLSRTGVLLYLSLAEHHAEIVADAAIHKRTPQESWGEAMAALIAEIKAGRPGEGIAAAVERIGVVLATHFPHTGTDPNELPDRMIEL